MSAADDISLACRLLAYDGHEHFCYGHVSVRLVDGNVAIKAAGVTLGGVTTHDVAVVKLDGTTISPGARLHDETPLHLGVYQARTDVNAVVHTHPEATVAASLLGPLGGVYSQDGVPFAGSLAWHPSARLINGAVETASFVDRLGDSRGAILFGHGIVTVGADLVEATVLALLLDRGMRTYLRAAAAGSPSPIDEGDLLSLHAAQERSYRRRIEDVWQAALFNAGLCPGR